MIGCAHAITEQIRAADDLFNAVRAFLDDEELVELTLSIALSS